MNDSSGVYYILNLQNDRIYVGQTMKIQERFVQHKQALKSKRHHNGELQNDWNTFGPQAFEFGVLVEVSPNGRLYYNSVYLGSLERIFIRVYQSDKPEFGYNADYKIKSQKSVAKMARLDQEANEAARTYRPR